MDKLLRLAELGNTYVEADSRYVVSLIVGYHDDEVISPEHAVASALDLTRNGNSYSTQWYVYDRVTQTLHCIEQQDAESFCETPLR